MINNDARPLSDTASRLSNPKMENRHLYGTSEGIVTPPLDAKQPVGGNGVDGVIYKTGVGTNGVTATSADMTNSSTNINQTSSDENLSAKFKVPNVNSDIDPVQVQYETHN